MCWFNIMYYLIRRGRENLREMTKSTFRIGTDASGKKFIYQTTSEIDKNHNENDTTNDTNGEGRIYATGTKKCPVACFEKMLRVLNPNIDALWQRPRAQMSIKKEIWFCNVPLGEKTLGGMLATLSVKYNLSQRYTNHSLRVTSIQVLEDANVETRHIVRVSGHKNPDSISSYARRLSAAKKRNCTEHSARKFCSFSEQLFTYHIQCVYYEVTFKILGNWCFPNRRLFHLIIFKVSSFCEPLIDM